jgi:hypothetical protein
MAVLATEAECVSGPALESAYHPKCEMAFVAALLLAADQTGSHVTRLWKDTRDCRERGRRWPAPYRHPRVGSDPTIAD